MKKRLEMIRKKRVKVESKCIKIHNRWCEDGRNRIELLDRMKELDKNRALLAAFIKKEEGLEELSPRETELVRQWEKKQWDKLINKHNPEWTK